MYYVVIYEIDICKVNLFHSHIATILLHLMYSYIQHNILLQSMTFPHLLASVIKKYMNGPGIEFLVIITKRENGLLFTIW